MRVGIYNEPSQGGIGGSEISAAVLAEALSRNHHQVEVVHHKPYLTRERLAHISDTDLTDVQMRLVSPEPYNFGSAQNPWRRYKEAASWQKELSEPYDLFINFTHGFPPFCHASMGALVILFPFHEPPHSRLLESSRKLRNALKFSYHEWEWRKRLSSYRYKSTISRFSQIWASRRWGVDCEVIHPPVKTHLGTGIKEDVILSVGRFTVTGHSKKQLEMMTAFKDLQRSASRDWEYFSIGGLSDSKEDVAYFRSVDRLAENSRAHVLANLERSLLASLHEKAKVFWHASGYGEDDGRPELSEHFGIATVEAMSAGCVPVVINKGGQPEIVEHEVSGFLWNSLDELKEYTKLLMRDEELRRRMEKVACARAGAFSRENFVNRFLRWLQTPIESGI